MLRTLFKTVKEWKQPKSPSTKRGVIHTVGYYHSTVKRNEVLICVAAWVSLRALHQETRHKRVCIM